MNKYCICTVLHFPEKIAWFCPESEQQEAFRYSRTLCAGQAGEFTAQLYIFLKLCVFRGHNICMNQSKILGTVMCVATKAIIRQIYDIDSTSKLILKARLQLSNFIFLALKENNQESVDDDKDLFNSANLYPFD